MGRTACTEPQCLYKGALYPYPTLRQSVCHGQEHYFDIRSKHWAKVQVFSDKQLPVTLAVFPCIEDASLLTMLTFQRHLTLTQSVNICKLCITSAAIFTSAIQDTITEMCMAAALVLTPCLNQHLFCCMYKD